MSKSCPILRQERATSSWRDFLIEVDQGIGLFLIVPRILLGMFFRCLGHAVRIDER